VTTAVLLRPEPGSETYKAPADEEELYRRDGLYVRRLVAKLIGEARPQDIEDVAADIMEKLVARNVISMYNPGYISEHNGRPVTWRAFLSNQVAVRVRGKREQLGRRGSRELLIADQPGPDGTTTWAETHGSVHYDEYPALSDVRVYHQLRDYLVLQPPDPGPLPLLELLDSLLTLVREGKKPSRAAVARQFKVTSSQVAVRMRDLKTALKEAAAMKPPVFKFGEYELTASQVQDAALALRESKGNRVAPALAAVQSPLADAGTRWFIKFGAQELKKHPELKRDKGTHTQGGHGSQTKDAIVHRLERVLAEAGTPLPAHLTAPAPDEPEAPPSPSEQMEAKLWQAGLNAEQVAYLVEFAEQVYTRE
jgi:hypothetical protein